MVEAFREDQQPEIPRETEGELPKELMYGLLGSLNGENKNLDIIVMWTYPNKVHSRMDLYRGIMNHQDPHRRWDMAKNVPFSHCEESLAPIGLVAKEELHPDGGLGYKITQYGIETGIPFAGGLLKWSYEHPNFSLYRIFGSTHTSSTREEQLLDRKRSPETRYKLLFEIATNPSNKLRQVDLIHEIGEKQGIIERHLASLSKNEIITYQAVEVGKPIVWYKLKEDPPLDKQPDPLKNYPTLSSQVFEILSENKGEYYLSIERVVNLLIEKYPNYRERKRQGLMKNVSKVLSDLERQRYSEREKFVGGQFLSEVTVSMEQREAIVSLLEFLDRFEKGDSQTLKEGIEFALRVASNTSLFSSLMLKAKEVSPSANRTYREMMELHVLSVLDGNSDITNNRLLQLLEQKLGKKISYSSINLYLRRLTQNGTIKSERTRSGNIYRLAEKESQTPSPQPE